MACNRLKSMLKKNVDPINHAELLQYTMLVEHELFIID